MSLSRVIGRDPPVVPAGGRPYVSHDLDDAWCVRVQMPGQEEGEHCHRLGPPFARQVTAYAYLDWVTLVAPTFAYPEGKA